MQHLLLLYKIGFYTFGFSVLMFTIYKYFTTRSVLVGSFLFFWGSMTATAASGIVAYYSKINFIDAGITGARFVVMLTLLLIAISLPNFVHRMFEIKRNFVIHILVALSVGIIGFTFLSLGEVQSSMYWRLVVSVILLSNIYSFIVGSRRVFMIKNIKDKKLGIFFLVTLTIHVSILFTSVLSSTDFRGFLYFPVLYMWIGGFNVYVAFTRLKDILKRSNNISNQFADKYKLTKRELEIAKLLVNGLSYKDIAAELLVSTNTVNTHVRNIYGKSKTNSKIQLSKEMEQYK